MMYLPRLDPRDDAEPFPDVEHALVEPNGLLALGGDLRPHRLIRAYRHGIFPWYSHGQPILWWTPNPRAVLYPERLKVGRSLRKTLRKRPYRVTMDHDFLAVIQSCAALRPNSDGTWITARMVQAYLSLYEMGFAHSVEVWCDTTLVGGLYGVAIGKVFSGESMFTRMPDASKIGVVYLVCQLRRWGFGIVDCQNHSPHLERLGAELIPRAEFIRCLNCYADQKGIPGPWCLDSDLELIF